MSDFILEYNTGRGNSVRQFSGTLADARKQACKLIGKSDALVTITEEIRSKTAPYYRQRMLAKIWYDADPGYAGYSSGNPGYWIQSYPRTPGSGKSSVTRRVSPKTGELLDVSKYYKSY